jgi:hypothetical protein
VSRENRNSACFKSPGTSSVRTKNEWRCRSASDPGAEVLDGNHDDITERDTPEPFVDASAAGRFLQLPRRRVLQLARQGRLPAYPIGNGIRRIWRFRLSELSSAMLHSRQRSHVPEEI